jgi:hypothetical protein
LTDDDGHDPFDFNDPVGNDVPKPAAKCGPLYRLRNWILGGIDKKSSDPSPQSLVDSLCIALPCHLIENNPAAQQFDKFMDNQIKHADPMGLMIGFGLGLPRNRTCFIGTTVLG